MLADAARTYLRRYAVAVGRRAVVFTNNDTAYDAAIELKEGGVDWALDQYNEKLITPEMKAKVDQAKADIVSGKIVVHDYMSNNACK